VGLVMPGGATTTFTGGGGCRVAVAVKTSPIRVNRTVSHAANANDWG